jgi:hypothetical protein
MQVSDPPSREGPNQDEGLPGPPLLHRQLPSIQRAQDLQLGDHERRFSEPSDLHIRRVEAKAILMESANREEDLTPGDRGSCGLEVLGHQLIEQDGFPVDQAQRQREVSDPNRISELLGDGRRVCQGIATDRFLLHPDSGEWAPLAPFTELKIQALFEGAAREQKNPDEPPPPPTERALPGDGNPFHTELSSESRPGGSPPELQQLRQLLIGEI